MRGTDKRGNVVTGDGITTTDAAVRAMRLLEWGHCTDVAIFRVHDDGREERLPSYEEALEIIRATIAETCAPMGHADLPGFMQRLLAEGREDPDLEPDPLAALEAAERRLLEAGGWTAGDRGFWIDPDDGTQWPREGAISDVRRRLAAKGGA